MLPQTILRLATAASLSTATVFVLKHFPTMDVAHPSPGRPGCGVWSADWLEPGLGIPLVRQRVGPNS